MARTTVTGRAGSDVELRFTPSGVAVGTVNVAEQHRKRVDGEWVDDGTSWYRVTIFGRKAETACDHVRKGALLVVTGDLRVRDYEGRDGTKGRSVEITADEIGVVPANPAGMRGAHRDRTGYAAPSTVQGASKLGTNSEDPWASGQEGGW